MILVWTIAAIAYALSLWQLARTTAIYRGVTLGGVPFAAIAIGAVCCGASAWLLPPLAAAVLGAGVVGAIICGIVDKRTGYIFDTLTIAIAIVSLSIALLAGSGAGALISSTIVGGSMLALYFVTARRGIGLGDVKLAAVLGLSLGTEYGAVAVGAAFIFGAAYGIALVLRHQATRGDVIRFGPFLAAGAVFAFALNLSGAHV
jgi:leader peptidase (prepilin peptidase) / N-methyltransferase